MGKMTEPKDARERMISAFDPYVYDSVYAKLYRAFGMNADSSLQTLNGYGDQIPRYKDIYVKTMTEGRSPRLLTASNVAVSRVASKMPSFKFPQLDQLDSAIRTEALRVTYHGEQHCFAPWHHGIASAFDDGDSIGYGAVEIWPIVNPNSGMPQAQLQPISCLDIAWDPHKADPHNSRYITTQKWVSVEEAAERIGWKKAKACAVKVYETSVSQFTWSCRLMTYYDYGYGKDLPAIMEFWGNIWHSPEAVYENPVGRPPLALCVNYVKNKMRRPLGRIDMQSQDYETLYQLEQTLLRSALNGQGAVMVDGTAIDEQDWEDFKAGLTRFLRYNSSMQNMPMQQIPTDQLQSALLPAIQWYASLYSQNSMMSDLQRGENGGDRKTATQNLIEDRNQSANMGWTIGMMLKFQMEICMLGVDVMRITDRHPRLLDVLGSNVPVNMPGVAPSTFHAMFSEPSRCEIGTDSLTEEDDKMKLAQERDLLVLTLQSGLVGTLIDPRWFGERWAALFGADPRTVLMQPSAGSSGAPAMAMNPAQAQAGQPQMMQ